MSFILGYYLLIALAIKKDYSIFSRTCGDREFLSIN